jgi:hypothetical protein
MFMNKTFAHRAPSAMYDMLILDYSLVLDSYGWTCASPSRG